MDLKELPIGSKIKVKTTSSGVPYAQSGTSLHSSEFTIVGIYNNRYVLSSSDEKISVSGYPSSDAQIREWERCGYSILESFQNSKNKFFYIDCGTPSNYIAEVISEGDRKEHERLKKAAKLGMIYYGIANQINASLGYRKLGYIYGGFIRDRIARKEFKDVDFFVKTNFNEVIQCLRDYGISVSEDSGEKECSYSAEYKQRTLTITFPGGYGADNTSYKLNLVRAINPAKNPTPYGNAENRSANLDNDINSLFEESGKMHSCLGDDKLNEIIDNIKHNRFRPQNGLLFNDSRVQKLIQKGFKNMSKTNGADGGFVGMVKQDATDAAYRIAATQVSKAVKTGILQALKNQGTKKAQIKTIMNMLDTDVGEALISMILGLGLTYAPVLKDNPRAGTLAQEFRIGAMAGAGNAVMDTVVSTLFPVLMQAVSSLPQEEVRVETKTRVEKVEEKLSDAVIEQAAQEELVLETVKATL